PAAAPVADPALFLGLDRAPLLSRADPAHPACRPRQSALLGGRRGLSADLVLRPGLGDHAGHAGAAVADDRALLDRGAARRHPRFRGATLGAHLRPLSDAIVIAGRAPEYFCLWRRRSGWYRRFSRL